jgi:hypothetical protein
MLLLNDQDNPRETALRHRDACQPSSLPACHRDYQWERSFSRLCFSSSHSRALCGASAAGRGTSAAPQRAPLERCRALRPARSHGGGILCGGACQRTGPWPPGQPRPSAGSSELSGPAARAEGTCTGSRTRRSRSSCRMQAESCRSRSRRRPGCQEQEPKNAAVAKILAAAASAPAAAAGA